MSSLGYSPYIQHDDADERNKKYIIAEKLIQEHIKKNNYIKLKSDYYSVDRYYYDKKNGMLYKVGDVVDFRGNIDTSFTPVRDSHILKLNNLI